MRQLITALKVQLSCDIADYRLLCSTVTDASRPTTACNSVTARTTILCGEGAAFQHRRHQRVFALLCAVLCGWRHRPPHADNNDNNVESTFLIGRGARMSLLCSQGGINSVGVAFR